MQLTLPMHTEIDQFVRSARSTRFELRPQRRRQELEVRPRLTHPGGEFQIVDEAADFRGADQVAVIAQD